MSDVNEQLRGDARADGSDAIRVGKIKDISSFLRHVDWSEPWIQLLMVFHVACFAVVLLTRHHTNIQAVLFILLLAVIFFAEQINKFAAMNYHEFSRLQYFDSSGLFISLILCTPVLINCFVMLICWLYTTGSMLIKVKRVQLIKRMKEEKRQVDAEEEVKKDR